MAQNLTARLQTLFILVGLVILFGIASPHFLTTDNLLNVMQQSEINAIKESVGGEQAYTEMIQWAGENLSDQEISDFNAVTGTGNVAAIRFAVESLSSRYRGSEGYEAPLVTGRKAPSKSSAGYRSHAELARDIADPRYNNDPAFRQDVEEKLSRSKDLL